MSKTNSDSISDLSATVMIELMKDAKKLEAAKRQCKDMEMPDLSYFCRMIALAETLAKCAIQTAPAQLNAGIISYSINKLAHSFSVMAKELNSSDDSIRKQLLAFAEELVEMTEFLYPKDAEKGGEDADKDKLLH